MELFFHHVGQKGADADFKKTVYKDISLEAVESNVRASALHRDELLNELRQRFPTGLFNCWGVPSTFISCLLTTRSFSSFLS